jgi:drug/metabolite transporter (DMT)-like permease
MSHTHTPHHPRATIALWLCAFIWGTTFLFQKTAMDHIPPLLFNAARFTFSVATLLLFLFWQRVRAHEHSPWFTRDELKFGALLGIILCGGITLQQIGVVHTTTSNASFITGLYVVLVPFFTRLVFGTPLKAWQLAMSALAGVGLFFLSTPDNNLNFNQGDIIILASTLLWAAHVGLMNRLSNKGRVVQMTLAQLTICAIISIGATIVFDPAPNWDKFSLAIPSLIYAGALSGGIAFMLQMYGQKTVSPSVAAIILSLESVFGALAGWYVLNDPFNARNLFGAALMLAAIVLIQFTDNIEGWFKKGAKRNNSPA